MKIAKPFLQKKKNNVLSTFTKITLTVKGEKAHLPFRYQRLQLLTFIFSEHIMRSSTAATSQVKSQ